MPPRTAHERRRAEARGRRAEWVAAQWLRAKGFRILDRRARTGYGEIDLVAQRGRLLAMVEVKERARVDDARTAIAPSAQSRLVRAGAAWRAARPWTRQLSVRFDLVIIAPWSWPIHVPDAWRGGDRLADLL